MLATSSLSRTMNSLPQIAPELSRLNVLVVDEDEAARSACIEIAGSLGYKAKGVSKLDRVRSTLFQFPTDIVLIDLPRSSDSGLEAVAEINATIDSASGFAITFGANCGSIRTMSAPTARIFARPARIIAPWSASL